MPDVCCQIFLIATLFWKTVPLYFGRESISLSFLISECDWFLRDFVLIFLQALLLVDEI